MGPFFKNPFLKHISVVQVCANVICLLDQLADLFSR